MSESGPIQGPRGTFSTTPMGGPGTPRRRGFGAVLDAPLDRPTQAEPPTSAGANGPAGALASAVFEDEAAIEDALARIERGETMDREELLALQARVYAYSQRVEVASRLVDRAAGALRHLLNIQL